MTSLTKSITKATLFILHATLRPQGHIHPQISAHKSIMSNQTYSTFSSSSYSSVSNSSGKSYTQASYSNPHSTTIHTTSQESGQPAVTETTHLPTATTNAQQVEGTDGSRRIEDVTDADREYEGRMEDEYAKREGGA